MVKRIGLLLLPVAAVALLLATADNAQAFGRRAMQIVFRCQACKVLFKRAHNLSFDF